MPLNREDAISLGRKHARNNPENYMPENMGGKAPLKNCEFIPHEWVIQSIIEASDPPLLITGENLYLKFRNACTAAGFTIDEWYDLDDIDKDAYRRLALDLI